MASKPFVSVIICTRDRAASLVRTLDSIVTAAVHVGDRWELLVVDNGSSDATAATIDAFAGRLPIRRVWQPVAGLSNARNAGVGASSGAYILWTDDDVVVDEMWLKAWFAAFRAHPDDAIFGGRAVPIYEEPHEPWFKANEDVLAALLAIRDQPHLTKISKDNPPFGLNFAIRSKEQKQHAYDPNLGVAPGRRRGGEETAIINALLDHGYTGRWVWDAAVYHLIPRERQTEQYIRSYYRPLGFDLPFMGLPGGLWQRLRALGYETKHLLKSWLLYQLLRRSDRARAVRWLVRNARASGSIRRYLGGRIA